eukprot:CAMPEP_0183721848 /NCGR_PEP_ID=MMETSP0737-20130205/13985_1 /TAXON_ID=385413 /ORGANISM="Thalassiosira miniscula, Strain CCMP1093" /LENGTH=289 /DNA_ID=CAMNT_0025951911 /DNA_START=133 /DNA_END=1002 /DNA_ORIENTATION=-
MPFKHVPASKLYASEPNPAWFGNPSNEPENPHWETDKSTNWLKSRFHFSFAEYSNYKNSNYGVLRVMNDDFVQPDRGFGTHPHRNMEIITYIVQGRLTHKDSMGTQESLGRGGVQFMTAGRGVQHSEYNHEKDKSLRFIQTWIVPRKSGLTPNYGSFDPEGDGKSACTAKNQWRHLVSDVRDKSVDAPVKIEQDANLHVAEMDRGQSLEYELKDGRMAYVLCVEGSVIIRDDNGNEVSLERHDGCEVKMGGKMTFEATGSETCEDGTDISAHVLVFEMAYDERSGRKDL